MGQPPRRRAGVVAAVAGSVAGVAVHGQHRQLGGPLGLARHQLRPAAGSPLRLRTLLARRARARGRDLARGERRGLAGAGTRATWRHVGLGGAGAIAGTRDAALGHAGHLQRVADNLKQENSP